MFISIWVHGTAGNVDIPCGEVDVFEVTGEKIHETILRALMDESLPSLKMDWFGELPTERVLLVEAVDTSSEDGVNIDIIDWFEQKMTQ